MCSYRTIHITRHFFGRSWNFLFACNIGIIGIVLELLALSWIFKLQKSNSKMFFPLLALFFKFEYFVVQCYRWLIHFLKERKKKAQLSMILAWNVYHILIEYYRNQLFLKEILFSSLWYLYGIYYILTEYHRLQIHFFQKEYFSDLYDTHKTYI